MFNVVRFANSVLTLLSSELLNITAPQMIRVTQPSLDNFLFFQTSCSTLLVPAADAVTPNPLAYVLIIS